MQMRILLTKPEKCIYLQEMYYIDKRGQKNLSAGAVT